MILFSQLYDFVLKIVLYFLFLWSTKKSICIQVLLLSIIDKAVDVKIP